MSKLPALVITVAIFGILVFPLDNEFPLEEPAPERNAQHAQSADQRRLHNAVVSGPMSRRKYPQETLDSRRYERWGEVVLQNGDVGCQGKALETIRQRHIRELGWSGQSDGGNQTVQGVATAATQAGSIFYGFGFPVGTIALRHGVAAVLHRTVVSLALHVMRADEVRQVGSEVEAAHMEAKDR